MAHDLPQKSFSPMRDLINRGFVESEQLMRVAGPGTNILLD